MSAISNHERGATVSIHVQPRASRTEVVSMHEGWLKVRVAAPPVDGAANAAIIGWLSKRLKVPKSDIVFLSGERGRRKVILVTGVTATEVCAALGLT